MNGEVLFWWKIITFSIFRDAKEKMLYRLEKAKKINCETKELLELINNHHKEKEGD